ncbi:NACHT domain-containing protein [Candidatus Halobeggiatoa sp. HSG11]|nr:NACHT domain-containing protein [Candidatus Halobeggiatoa sp. HSG11]
MIETALGIAAGVASSASWDGIKKYFTSKKDSNWKNFNFSQAENEYRNNIKLLYGKLRILGNLNTMPLEGIFSDVFILDKISATRKFDLQRLLEDDSVLEDMERQNGLELIKDDYANNRLFILGKPGAGKTTFLKYIALQAADYEINKIPIFVGLKEWSDSGLDSDSGLIEFLVKQFDICNFPQAQDFIEHILKTGDAIVLFDGLDEVVKKQRDNVIHTVENFTKKYTVTQCLVTCRIASNEYQFDQFKYVEMADFTNEQMRTFATKWFQKDAEKQKLFLEEFFKDEHESLRDLGRIPLLLGLLCLNFEATLSFPARKVELYEEAIEALLKKWDANRNIKRDTMYHKLSLGRKRQLFSKVAYENFVAKKIFFKQRDLTKQIVKFLDKVPNTDKDDKAEIEGDEVLKEIESQHGIFVERAFQIYSFSHLTFQEYFTARFIANNPKPKKLKALIQHRLQDTRWQETLMLTVNMLEDDADEFFVVFKQIIDEIINDDKQLVKFINWADTKAQESDMLYKLPAVRTVYCFFTHILDIDRGRIYVDRFAIDRGRGRIYVDRFAIDRVLSRDIVLDLAFELGGLANDIDLDLSLAHAHKDFNLYYFLPIIKSIIKSDFKNDALKKFTVDFRMFINKLSDSQLKQALSDLKPSVDYGKEQWQSFATKLQQIMQTHCNIGHEWNFNKEQQDKLEQYFKANRILVQCLNSAMVSSSDRERIENSLLTFEEL